jgi:hypothetical protein
MTLASQKNLEQLHTQQSLVISKSMAEKKDTLPRKNDRNTT